MSEPSPAQLAHSPALRRWLGIAVMLLALPLLAEQAQALADPLRRPLAPSFDSTWALMLAGLGAGVYVGLLWRADRRGLRRGAGIGVFLALAAAASLTALHFAAPPALAACGGAPDGTGGAIDAQATIDGRRHGQLRGATDDGAGLRTLLGELAGVPFEDRGVEAVAGVAARRCAVLISGSQALTAFPPLRELVGEPGRPVDELAIWRGELEWWTSVEGRLVLARLRVGGHPADAWASRGLRGELSAEFRLVRGVAR